MRLQEVGGRATQEAKAEYRLRAWDNITQLEGRGPTLFTQPTSRGSGDCIYANNSKNDQDTTDDCMEAGGRAKQEARAEEALSQVQAISACLVMKNIGKPCTGKPYARFDEGGQVNVTMTKLLRHRQRKGRQQIGLIYGAVSLLSTLPMSCS